ncbi:MAG: quinone-dependent dihydroorotate dehydrogenase, partial [Leadbetterella sp.]
KYHRPVNALGLSFPNPVGLAAGFDKNAIWIDELAALGFGFVEVGTVTPLAQDGNPKPRLFRLKKDKALINRMGFNNHGLEPMVAHLKNRKSNIIVGGNLGKNKVTPNEEALNDYLLGYRALVNWVDYFVVNVSSPNTPGLRELQEKEPLTKLLQALQDENKGRKPILLKIAPDLSNSQLDDIVDIVVNTNLAGVIATNTTIERSSLTSSKKQIDEIGNGGLSGKPLKDRSTEVIRYLNQKGNNRFTIIGAGGIQTGSDAQEKLDAGATLIQVYSGFVYEGPGIAKSINQYLSKSV